MADANSHLEKIAAGLREELAARYRDREKALQLSRDSIRHCANAIRAIHRGEFPEAEGGLKAAKAMLGEMRQAVAAWGELRYSGFIQDATKEYAEGRITLALVRGEAIPSPEELEVDAAPYLNGMGEAAGEMRRFLLDSLRRGALERCEEHLAAMDDIYTLLVTMDFPDSLTGGLRRTTDMVRGVLERTRGDLTMAVRQQALERRLEEFQGG